MKAYVLITDARVRVYSTASRALKVAERARRMGVQVEYLSAAVIAGDPFKRVKAPACNWLDPACCPSRTEAV